MRTCSLYGRGDVRRCQVIDRCLPAGNSPPPTPRSAGWYARTRTRFSELGMADAAGVAAVLQPPRRAPVAQERFKWTPKQSLSYLATFFVATWLGAFLITFLLVQVLLRMS